MARQINEIRLYWDSADPDNEGWAYWASATDENGESQIIDSGPYAGTIRDGDLMADMADAVVAIAYGLSIIIEPGEVATMRDDGGHAIWSR